MKVKQLLFSLSIIAILTAFLWVYKSVEKEEFEGNEPDGMEEDMMLKELWMNKMLADPSTGKIPYNIRQKEIQFASTLPVEKNLNKANRMGFWVNRGPDNVGGRTRAIAIDKTNENILIAGATTGGIWRSENAGASWQLVTSLDSFINATCIVQDQRKGKEKNWYVGTGEWSGGYVPGEFILGNGILKSTDGGKNWVRLKSTNSNNFSFDVSFDFNNNIALNKAIDSIDVIFSASYGCINRSVNGGTSWSTRRGGMSQPSAWTDVAITTTGIVYATLSGKGNNAGIWRSKDNGNTWANITPTWFNVSTGRVVIGIAPSDENQLYFAAYTPDFGKKSTRFDGGIEWNSLWKYTYVSGDGTATGGQWEDRSNNMPSSPLLFGDYISQGGYCLEVKVKPDNPNVVFLGGMNLFRSDDAFATTTKTHWIGGYEEGTTLPDFKVYLNHHPDQHGLVFYPSNANRMITTNDGGIQRTENCMDNKVVWTSLNNGYVTTQFYTVAIDKTSTNNVIIGGLQDNGTLLRPDNFTNNNWSQPFSYDGSFGFVGANAAEYYMSIQQGRVYRLQLDANYKPIKSARIDCKNAKKDDYEFINPFTPDVANFKRVYIPNGKTIWRNNDVTQIPLHDILDSTATDIGWEIAMNTNVGDSSICAITSASNDILYYGTTIGQLYRIRNASTANPLLEDIHGTNFPTGYINCIATHPTDTSKLYVVFTNYGIVSLYYSENSGQTWQAIAGNLEDNVSGGGNGPSCRWFKVVPIGNTIYYYVGTSTGLFATDALNGNSTIWVKQAPDKIGYNIVTMIEHRTTDGLMAVSTFGAGVFTALLISEKDQTGIKNIQENSLSIYPNPVNDILQIRYDASYKHASFEIYNLKGQLLKNGILNKEIQVEELADGTYILKLHIDGKTINRKFIKQ